MYPIQKKIVHRDAFYIMQSEIFIPFQNQNFIQNVFPSVLTINNNDQDEDQNQNQNQETSTSEEDQEMNEGKINETNRKKTRKEIYGKGIEARTIKEELGEFDVFNSRAYKEVSQRFGRSIRLSELLGILNSIQIYLQMKQNNPLPQISRNEKRSFPLLIKYIERNSDLIFPLLQYISLCNSSFQKIPLDN